MGFDFPTRRLEGSLAASHDSVSEPPEGASWALVELRSARRESYSDANGVSYGFESLFLPPEALTSGRLPI